MLDAEFWGNAHRKAAWRFELVTPQGGLIKPLEGVTGGNVNWAQGRAVHGAGSLTITCPDGRDFLDGIDWLNARIAVKHVVEIDGHRVEVPWGVFLASSEVTTVTKPGVTTVSVQLVDVLASLQQDSIPGHATVPVGHTLSGAIRDVMDMSTETRYAVSDTTAQVRTSMAWLAGTSLLRMANDLCESAGFQALHADDSGVIKATPYISPEMREPLWRFIPGANSIHLPEDVSVLNASDVPNRVVLVSREDEGKTALIGLAENESKGRFSREHRGRWVTHHEEGFDAASQSIIDAAAERKLAELSRVAVRTPIQHLPIPLPLGSAVLDNQGRICVVVERECSFEPGAMMKTTIRRFEEVS